MIAASATPVALIVFWVAFVGVGYAYIGYPLLLILVARLWGVKPAAPFVAESELPSVTLLIVVNNEEAMMAARLENARAKRFTSASATGWR